MTRPGPSAPAAFRIRLADAGDDAAVARELAAYLASIGATLDADLLDRDIARWTDEYDGRRGVMLVVEDAAGQVVGTAGIRALDDAGVGELKRMWVRPECRGAGLGRLLMARGLDEARRLGFRRLRLDSRRDMTAAVALYRSCGFRDIAPYNANPRAEIWMEAALGSVSDGSPPDGSAPTDPRADHHHTDSATEEARRWPRRP
jgi:ribosomal protein S18 acetylase RimI-like enzyme